MKAGKKQILIPLLLSLLFLFGQVAVNKVLCCTSDGSRNIEFAFFGIECDCFKESCQGHSHDHEKPSGNHPQKDAAYQTEGCGFCIDIPLADYYLIFPLLNLNVKNIILKNIDLNRGLLTDKTSDGYLSFNLFPLSKFLFINSIFFNKAVLLC